jgi:hypothetical protein
MAGMYNDSNPYYRTPLLTSRLTEEETEVVDYLQFRRENFN